MLEQVIRAVEAYDLLKDAQAVTVALSGGADSTALLYAMQALQSQYGFALYAAHFNHCLRGSESDADQAFVQDLCQKLGIELFCGKGDVAALAKAQKCSIELAARQARYDFLNQVAKGKIATAHTADDTLETVLFCLARGTGLKGLCGIPPKRGQIIRPMLFCTRAQVEAYLEQKGASYRTDSSNESDDYTRNRIRHHAVPTLTAINEAAVEHTAQLCYRLRQDDDYLTQAAQTAIAQLQVGEGLKAKGLADLHPAIRIRVLRHLFAQAGVPMESLHLQRVEQLLSQTSGRVSLREGFVAQVKGGVLQITPQKTDALPTVALQLQNGCFQAAGFQFSVVNREEFSKIHNLLYICALDYDKIVGTLYLRPRQSGDRFKSARRGVTKSLKKLFCEANIPLGARESVPVLADRQGVLFVQGYGADARAVPSAQTQTFLVIAQEKTTEQ